MRLQRHDSAWQSCLCRSCRRGCTCPREACSAEGTCTVCSCCLPCCSRADGDAGGPSAAACVMLSRCCRCDRQLARRASRLMQGILPDTIWGQARLGGLRLLPALLQGCRQRWRQFRWQRLLLLLLLLLSALLTGMRACPSGVRVCEGTGHSTARQRITTLACRALACSLRSAGSGSAPDCCQHVVPCVGHALRRMALTRWDSPAHSCHRSAAVQSWHARTRTGRLQQLCRGALLHQWQAQCSA